MLFRLKSAYCLGHRGLIGQNGGRRITNIWRNQWCSRAPDPTSSLTFHFHFQRMLSVSGISEFLKFIPQTNPCNPPKGSAHNLLCHQIHKQIHQQVRSLSTGLALQNVHNQNRSSPKRKQQKQGKKPVRNNQPKRSRPSLISSLILEQEMKERVESPQVVSLQEKYKEIENMFEAADADEEDSSLTDSESDLSDDEEEILNKDADQANIMDGDDGIEYIEELELDLGFDREETEEQEEANAKEESYSGVPDPKVPISTTPCSGCGALLHCQDPGIPGYMPSQKYKATPKRKLREEICQRCFLMNRHNLALKASVAPEEYREIIAQIKQVRALVIVMVDVMDMPNSVFPNLSELIGKKRPLYIIGNKADLLPRDSPGYLKRIKDMLIQQCEEAGLTTSNYVKHVGLISAKTGYGVEELTTRLMQDWGRKGHIYILGCTNVGKSSLFNSLLSSDLCKEAAMDFINRATTSLWPGTTVNLLKFPVINPEPWKLARRVKRLKVQKKEEAEERAFHKAQFQETKQSKYLTLMGHMGRTFDGYKNVAVSEEDSKGFSGASFSFNPKTGAVEAEQVDKERLMGHQYDETIYANSRWCFDTPGVVNPEQVINHLTQHELSVLLTNRIVVPRTFILKPGQSMLVSGLSRIDYIKGERSVYFTVFAAQGIPVRVRDYVDMDDFYTSHIGTRTLGVPLGGADRLRQLPALIGKELSLTGTSWKESAADIVLSSIGWVAVTLGPDLTASLRAYTPGGRGCCVRTPALLPHAINLRGKRCRSAAYHVKPLQYFDET